MFFMNLEKAVEETYRVLKHDGLFVHMLDLGPSTKPIIQDLSEKGVPLQIDAYETPTGYLQINSIKYVPEERLEEFNREVAELPKDIDGKDLDESKRLIKKENKIWRKYSQEVPTRDYFTTKLIRSLSPYFKEIESGELVAGFKGKRTRQQQDDGEYFLYFNDAGQFCKYLNSLQYCAFNLKFLGISDILHGFHEAAYRALKPISPSLANKIEPPCIEISVIKYVKARIQAN